MALIPVMTAAGAVVTDWQGAAVNLYGDGSILAASNADLHKKALAHLSQGL
jgi:fructose-1,6-bisphosphatase/inositol monophosphatase family enzyme